MKWLIEIVVGVFIFCAVPAIPSTAQTLTTLASFNLNNGYDPVSGLAQRPELCWH